MDWSTYGTGYLSALLRRFNRYAFFSLYGSFRALGYGMVDFGVGRYRVPSGFVFVKIAVWFYELKVSANQALIWRGALRLFCIG